jgi:hypothetical protein
MRSLRKSLCVAVLLVVAGDATAGPFGLDMGMSVADLQKVAKIEGAGSADVFRSRSVPNPHPAFQTYLMLVSPTLGLCKVTAVGAPVKSNAFGDAIKRQFDELEESLKTKYGNSKRFDFLQVGSIWNEPKDWMMALTKKERSLDAYWNANERSMLSNDIAVIHLEAVGLSRESGLMRLSYEFSNFKQCFEESKRKRDSAL